MQQRCSYKGFQALWWLHVSGKIPQRFFFGLLLLLLSLLLWEVDMCD
jgi:hypothetical protein